MTAPPRSCCSAGTCSSRTATVAAPGVGQFIRAREVRRAAPQRRAGGGRHVTKLEWLAGAALSAVVAVAAVDAIRNRDTDERRGATTERLADRDQLAEQAARVGVRGELLLYGDGCRVEALELPSLEEAEEEDACVPRGAVSPNGALAARCLGDDTEVFYTSDGGLHSIVPGCAPAWRPDGVLTVAHEREVVRFRACAGPETCPETLISRSELEWAARRHPSAPDSAIRLRVLVDGIAWISNTRAAVLLSIRIGGRPDRFGLSAIAFFENGLGTPARPYLRATGGRLGVSPRGTYVTMIPDVILRGDGSQVSLPPHVLDAHAFGWSKDERFLAVATRFAVTVLDVASLDRYDTIGSGLRSVTLPLRVTELAWR